MRFVHIRQKFYVRAQARISKKLLHLGGKRDVSLGATACHTQLQVLDAVTLAQRDIGLHERLEALCPAHPGEVAENRRVGCLAAWTRVIAFEIDPVVHYMYAIG